MTSNSVFSNDNYVVVVGTREDSDLEYVVLNTVTNVKEYKTQQLPDAINYAEHSNSYILNELWSWIKQSGKESKAEMEKFSMPDLEADLLN